MIMTGESRPGRAFGRTDAWLRLPGGRYRWGTRSRSRTTVVGWAATGWRDRRRRRRKTVATKSACWASDDRGCYEGNARRDPNTTLAAQCARDGSRLS